jgi:uncharacterized protein (TIGR02271 family)
MNATERGIREGMIVKTSDGHKLGKIIACEPETFIVEKGFFLPKEYIADYTQVSDVRDDEVWLMATKDQILGSAHKTDTYREGTYHEGTTAGLAAEEQRVTLSEEELVAQKSIKDAGEVRIHKDVKTERRDISVPVMKEEVRVERVPATESTARAGDAAFHEETIRVPIQEEEVEIRKRPVVKEELRVTKDRTVQERHASETVRKETADIDKTGKVVRKDDEPGGYK